MDELVMSYQIFFPKGSKPAMYYKNTDVYEMEKYNRSKVSNFLGKLDNTVYKALGNMHD